MARSTRTRIAPLLAFGVSLARRGILPIISMAICAMTVIGIALLAIVLASRGRAAPLHDVPLVASSALAWGGGFLHAFATAAHALRKDRTEGIRDLLSLRTTSLRGYLVARVGGLATLLAIVLGGGTLLCGLVSVLAATRMGVVPKTLQATLAGLVFAIAFAVVVAPVAFAALGARSRIGGYLFLIGVVVLPEIIASSLSNVIPESVTEVLAIPSALSALRSALAPGGLDALRALRAIVALGVFTGIALVLVRRDAIRLEHEEVPS